MSDMAKKLADLEKRIEELERRPVYYPQPVWIVPWNPVPYYTAPSIPPWQVTCDAP